MRPPSPGRRTRADHDRSTVPCQRRHARSSHFAPVSARTVPRPCRSRCVASARKAWAVVSASPSASWGRWAGRPSAEASTDSSHAPGSPPRARRRAVATGTLCPPCAGEVADRVCGGVVAGTSVRPRPCGRRGPAQARHRRAGSAPSRREARPRGHLSAGRGSRSSERAAARPVGPARARRRGPRFARALRAPPQTRGPRLCGDRARWSRRRSR
jgi:hypothetical protein